MGFSKGMGIRLLFALLVWTGLGALEPGPSRLAATPPMGWNSWNTFNTLINEELIKGVADAMVSSGMKAAGFQYVILDDGWQKVKGPRGAGPLAADPVKFPHGMKYLADYVHSKGLKFGIYSGPGVLTCAGYAGSLGHEAEDARMWASWGVDYLKYDGCCQPGEGNPQVQELFAAMAAGLRGSGRDIVLSVCHCGFDNVWQWAGKYGHQWRIAMDIADQFGDPGGRWPGHYNEILNLIDLGVGLEKFSGPGGWNDYDMLVVGIHGSQIGDGMPGAGCTALEYQTHFSMWSILCSPLIAGNDLTKMDRDTVRILTNKEVIALNQDPLGIQAARVKDGKDLQIFAKPLADGSWAVALLNRGAQPARMTVSLKEDLKLPWARAAVRDLWKHRNMGTHPKAYSASVRGHEAVMLVLRDPGVGAAEGR